MAEDTTGAPPAAPECPAAATEGTTDDAFASLQDHQFTRDDELEDVLAAETREPVPSGTASDVDESEHKIFGVPVDAFVRFGTTSSGHDKLMAQRQAEEEQRRAEDDADRERVKKKGLGAGDPNEIATQYSHEFTEHPEIMRAFVPLQYLSRGPNPRVVLEGVGDIIMPQNPQFENELALMIFCPRCKERLHAAHCIITIRQSHRYWELDKRGAGELFIWEGEPLRSAGTVMDSEKFTCGRCSWSARIHKNQVRPE